MVTWINLLCTQHMSSCYACAIQRTVDLDTLTLLGSCVETRAQSACTSKRYEHLAAPDSCNLVLESVDCIHSLCIITAYVSGLLVQIWLFARITCRLHFRAAAAFVPRTCHTPLLALPHSIYPSRKLAIASLRLWVHLLVTTPLTLSLSCRLFGFHLSTLAQRHPASISIPLHLRRYLGPARL